jgi:hypothetical protein
MKKLMILVCSLICVNAFSQLKVGSNGNILINTSTTATPLSKLSVGCTGNSGYLAAFSASGIDGLLINNYGRNALTINNYCNGAATNGINILPMSGYGSTPCYGINAFSGITTGNRYGISGLIFNLTNGLGSNAAGIYGSSSVSSTFAYSGIYAGYFNGDVRVTGTLYGTLLTPSGSSSSNVSAYSGGDESISDRFARIDLQQSTLKEEKSNASPSVDLTDRMKAGTLTEKDILASVEACQKDAAVQTARATVNYGLNASQLKEEFPELVYEDKDGNVSINYMEMIPLLVQSVKELKARITELSGDKAAAAKSGVSDISSLDAEGLLPSLAQNDPNPFTEKTVVRFTLPETVQTATLYIYDMSGTQISTMPLSERGNASVTIAAQSLHAGMYLYSLVADGKLISTRRMILTK